MRGAGSALLLRAVLRHEFAIHVCLVACWPLLFCLWLSSGTVAVSVSHGTAQGEIMSEDSTVMDVLVRRAEQLATRRQFFRSAGGVGLGLIGGTILGACGGGSSSASAQSGPTDPEILNFALNLEYLEATFYAYATTGAGLSSSLMSGAGTPGTVIPGHAVTFTDPVVQAYANEIAKDELEHAPSLRTALGASAVAMPALDVGYQNPNGAFSKAAQAAGLVPAGTA